MPRDSYYLPQRRLVSQQAAAIIENARIPRSKFINRFSRKTAFNAGDLVPFLIDEVLPGDHMKYNATAYVRMATPLFPLFDQQQIETFFFFTPSRICWDNWVKMMGEQDNPTDTIAYTVPFISLDNDDLGVNTIYDHFGLPAQFATDQSYEINALPLRAYNLIWNQWFRDENVNASTAINKGNGPDASTDYVLKKRAKAHDYFTSCLPWAQKFTAPTVPLGGLAPILGIGFDNITAVQDQAVNDLVGGTGYVYPWSVKTSNADQTYIRAVSSASGSAPSVYADLSQATGVAINTFRQAFMIQTLLERDARGGTRYTESIRSQFGVINPDFRLQRPEYIGGGKTPLITTPIAQTAPTEDSVVGQLGGASTAAGRHIASYAATEHGYIIGLINVRSELSYYQGLHKLWTRTTRYDFYTPALAGLGEQPVYTREIYSNGDTTNDTTVFGYQARWEEYRQRYSDITGLMRPTYTGNLAEWHLAQTFETAPTLSAAFLREDPPMARVLAAGEEANNQQYIADITIDRVAVRPIPMFGTPQILGRF